MTPALQFLRTPYTGSPVSEKTTYRQFVNRTVYGCYDRKDTMEFPFRCPSCGALNPIEYKADDHYKFECHRCNQMNEALIKKEKFELLFDFGSWAFLDGYYREVVANFATSLERFLSS